MAPAFLSSFRHREIAGALKRVRKIDYDLPWIFRAPSSLGFFAKLGGAKILAGYVDPRESATRFFYTRVLLRQGEHVIEQNLHSQVKPSASPWRS